MPSIDTDDTSVVRPSAPPAPAWTPTPDELQAWADTMSRREKSRRLIRLLATGLTAAAAVLAIVLLTVVLGPSLFNAAPQHVPSSIPGPTVPTVTGSRSDTIAPTVPTGLRLTSRSTTSVTIVWEAATDNMRVAGYIVTRDGAQVGTTYAPSFTDSGLRAATTYRYRITAFDDTGNISEPSSAVSASTLGLHEADTVAPAPPGNLAVTGQTTTTITLGWSAATDNVGVAGYDVFRDGQYIATVWQPGYTDTGLSTATSYTYRVTAFDATYNTSHFSRAVTGTTNAAPAAPPAPPQTSTNPQPTAAPSTQPTQPPTTAPTTQPTTSEPTTSEPTQPTPTDTATETQPTPTETETETEPAPTETETDPPQDQQPLDSQPPEPPPTDDPTGEPEPAGPASGDVSDPNGAGDAAGTGEATGDGQTPVSGEATSDSTADGTTDVVSGFATGGSETGEGTPAPSDQDGSTPPAVLASGQAATRSGRRQGA